MGDMACMTDRARPGKQSRKFRLRIRWRKNWKGPVTRMPTGPRSLARHRSFRAPAVA